MIINNQVNNEWDELLTEEELKDFYSDANWLFDLEKEYPEATRVVSMAGNYYKLNLVGKVDHDGDYNDDKVLASIESVTIEEIEEPPRLYNFCFKDLDLLQLQAIGSFLSLSGIKEYVR